MYLWVGDVDGRRIRTLGSECVSRYKDVYVGETDVWEGVVGGTSGSFYLRK